MAAGAGRPHAQTSSIPLVFLSRSFTDRDGVRWLVYQMEPGAPSAALELLRPRIERRRAWLAFESEHGEIRRIVPLPAAWPRCPESALAEWCDAAEPMTPSDVRRSEDPIPSARLP